MKIIIVCLLIFISFTNGNDFVWELSADSISNETNTTNSTTSTTTTTTTTVATTTTTIVTTTTLSPTATVGINVTWIFYSGVNVTYVEMTINNLQSNQWAAIGLGEQKAMKNAHVFMCKRLSDDKIQMDRYVINVPYDTPDGAGPEQGGVVTLGPQTYSNGVVTCRFNLSNFNAQSMLHLNNPKKLSQSGDYYPLFAVGLLDNSNEPQQHAKDSCSVLTDTVQLNTQKTVLYKVDNPPTDSSSKYFQAHGIIMVFAWMFFASTGILLSRYFKKSWIDSLVCGKAVWFAGHRFIMSIVTILTIIAFLFILVALQGAWVGSKEEIKHYVHSITGAMVISFAFFQPFIALFRCDPDSRYRFIYNYVHGFFGYSALALSIVTLFLASYFKLFKNDGGRVVMTLWAIWIVLIFGLFEFIQIYFRKKNQGLVYADINVSNKSHDDVIVTPTSEQKSAAEQKVKNILLAIHVLIAAILSIVMSVLIG